MEKKSEIGKAVDIKTKVKPKKKQKPRSSKQLPPVKKEEELHPEDAFLREWTKRVLED